MNPSLPPPVSLYTRHALALAASLELLHSHWLSFRELIPEDHQDGVLEPEIFEAFKTLRDCVQGYAMRVAMSGSLTDQMYHANVNELAHFLEFQPLESLTAMHAMHVESWTRELPVEVDAGR